MKKLKIKIIFCFIFLFSFLEAIYATDAFRSSGHDASKNIYSSNVIIARDFTTNIDETEDKDKVIKHMLSINCLDDENYEIIQDENADRIMIKIFLNDGIIYAKDGFYKLNNKIYYFDSEGHMVLGPCVDKEGKYYFFSYETGEMLEG